MQNINKYDSKMLKDILDDVRVCTLLYCTKNGKVHSDSAEEFLSIISEYSRYCIPEMGQKWQEDIRKIVYSPLVPRPGFEILPHTKSLVASSDYEIIDTLYNFINAGIIMQIYDENHSWEEVEMAIDKQGHSGYTFSGLANVMIEYSRIGVEFIERFDPDRIDRDDKFKEIYLKQKEYQEKRNELNKRLVLVLSKKAN